MHVLADLVLDSSVDAVVLEGDILEVRPYTIAPSKLNASSRLRYVRRSIFLLLCLSSLRALAIYKHYRMACFSRKKSILGVRSIQEVQIPKVALSTFGVTARPGIFTVTPVKAEGLPIAGLFRVGRASLGIRLFPYEEQVSAPAAVGPDFMWGAPMHFKHTDATREQLLFHIQIVDDPVIGTRNVVG